MDCEACRQNRRWRALTTKNLLTQIVIDERRLKMYQGRTTKVKNAIFIKSIHFSAIKLYKYGNKSCTFTDWTTYIAI